MDWPPAPALAAIVILRPATGAPTTFEAFQADALAADTMIATHTHAFGVEAVVRQREMWLHVEGNTLHLMAGDGVTLSAGVPHDERYRRAPARRWRLASWASDPIDACMLCRKRHAFRIESRRRSARFLVQPSAALRKAGVGAWPGVIESLNTKLE